MTVEVMPVGRACNLRCKYCYQAHDREGEKIPPLDIEAMMKATRGCEFSLHGGEALLAPKETLREFFKRGAKSIQTNGTLIDDEIIAVFKEFDVGVGVSIDGPGEMNYYRCTPEQTADVTKTITLLRQNGIRVSIIATMTDAFNVDTFKKWGLWLHSIGIFSVNLHTLQGSEGSLPESIVARNFLDLAAWLEEHSELRWNPFMDIKGRIENPGNEALCHLNYCDPLSTRAVSRIERDGSLHPCSRLGEWLKTEYTSTLRRALCLTQTPQENGGCRGCRFFSRCTGGCPGEALDGDWRNRTVHCPAYKALFRFYEDKKLDRDGVQSTPMSLPIKDCGGHGDTPHGDSHGDHYDGPR